ncbi:MAG TPA: NHLP bacteriocin export ABC transporter permease/ATPase subunit [Vicinamibacterales bacterium]|nr:NHLP bacteriocin export ABC transporter permease/ATPase subunit [Vicinamibacterales bacterium]
MKLLSSSEAADPTDAVLAQLQASAIPLNGAGPFLLDETDAVWLVERGEVLVFAAEVCEGHQVGPRRYLWTTVAPGVLFGVEPANGRSSIGLVAVGSAATRAWKVPRVAFEALGRHAESAGAVAALLDSFVTSASSAVASRTQPQFHALLEAHATATLRTAQRASAKDGAIWVVHECGASSITDRPMLTADPSSPPLPIARGLWVAAGQDDVRIAALGTREVLEDGRAWKGLDCFCTFLQRWAEEDAATADAAERERLVARARAEKQMRRDGLTGLADVLTPVAITAPAATQEDALVSACRAIGRTLGITFEPPPRWEVSSRARDPLGSICRTSRVRYRRVALTGRWWRSAGEPLLAFRSEGREPVALLPGTRGYDLLDPMRGSRVHLAADDAAALDRFGYQFYAPAPDRPLTGGAIARLGLDRTGRDLLFVVLTALAGSLLGLSLPIATGAMFSSVIPNANAADARTLLAALVAMALGTALFEMTRAFALIRAEGRTNATMQALLVDRLLSLPVPFFRNYSVGDLAQRASAVNRLRVLFSGAATTSLLSGLFSVVYLGLLLYYDLVLALVAVSLLAVTVLATAACGVAAVRVRRRQQDAAGRIGGLVFQMVSGISKLRVAAAEGRAFAVWCRRFREQKQLALVAGRYQNAIGVLNDVLPIVSLAVLFGAVQYRLKTGHDVHTGTFIAFNAAFGTFFASGIAFSNTMIGLLEAVPIFERARPIFETAPEVDAARPDAGELTGRVEGSHLSFRYSPDGPLVLQDISFRVEPGEFVAFVGPSGSGKSTLLRLLLGFESPETGTIYYDGHDLGSVDVSAVRSQIGVVLQSSKLMAGDVFTNIVGSAPLTLDEAWEAAEMAGFADDIRAMPMGMHTMISEGASTLSGGQRQRLLIARALVRRPRLIFFDEATSALDNRTQEIVSRSLERMNATRLVIAHRLSTIRHADRIFVVDRGRLVQEGSFDELSRQPGLFAQLIARQVA